NFCQVMIDCKTIKSFKDIYWDIRPRPDLGTVEFRICDMPADLTTTFGLVALTRCLVINGLRLLDERPQALRGDMRRHWIAVENKWLATRYGLTGMYIRTPSGKRRQLRHEVTDPIQRLMPLAPATGAPAVLLPRPSPARGAIMGCSPPRLRSRPPNPGPPASAAATAKPAPGKPSSTI